MNIINFIRGIFSGLLFSVVARIITIVFWILITICIILFSSHGAYNHGYSDAAAVYQQKIDLQQKEDDAKYAALLEEENNIQNTVVTKYIDRIHTITQKEYIYEKEINDIPTQCNLSNGWVRIHDASASGDSYISSSGSTQDSDAKASGITDTKALSVVIENYSTCQQNAAQLEALQKWINDTRIAIQNTNNKK